MLPHGRISENTTSTSGATPKTNALKTFLMNVQEQSGRVPLQIKYLYKNKKSFTHRPLDIVPTKIKTDRYFKYYPKLLFISRKRLDMNLPNVPYLILDYLKQLNSINLIHCLH